MQNPSLFVKFELFLPTKVSLLTMLFVTLSYWSITRLGHNKVYIPLTLSLYSFAFLPSTGLTPRVETLLHFPLIIFPELNYCSKNILKQLQNLSSPNFFKASSKTFKEFLACKIVLAANHQYLGIIQRLFRLQNCLSYRSLILEIFEDRFACKIVLAANHQYPRNIQKLCRLQNCLSRKSSVSQNNSKSFSPATSNRLVTSSNHQYPSRNQQSSSNQQQLAATSSN